MHQPIPWKTISTKLLVETPRLSVQEDIVELPNGKQSTYHLQKPTLTHSVIALAFNDKGELLVQREYSYPPNQVMWQLPGGAMKKNETPIDAANRELTEESGYVLSNCKAIGYFFVNNRTSNRKQYIVTGNSPSKTEIKPDADEFIHSEWMSLSKLNTLIAAGEINNINLLAALRYWEATK